MGRYDMADAQADMADADMAEEAAEAHYRALIGEEVTSNELNSYADWLAPGLEAAEALNKSSPRAVICDALAGMPNFMIDVDRDEHLALTRPMIETIVPPSGHPSWQPYGRPSSLIHQLLRMEGRDKNKKPVDLITVDRVPINRMGAHLKSYKLTRTGICYAHLHGTATADDLVRYWRHVTQGVEVKATNHNYLALTGQEPPPDDSLYQYDTPGSAHWGVLASLMREDTDVCERYRDHSGNKLRNALGHVYAGPKIKEAAEAMKFLVKEDQRALCHDVLLQSKVDNLDVREDFIDGLYADKVTYEDRVEKLSKTYKRAHPDSNADQVVGELICRAVWSVIRRVMDHRMADDVETAMGYVIPLPPERLTRVRLLQAVEKWDLARKRLDRISADRICDPFDRTEAEADERAGDEIAELQGERNRGS